jgi:hypothetical protein
MESVMIKIEPVDCSTTSTEERTMGEDIICGLPAPDNETSDHEQPQELGKQTCIGLLCHTRNEPTSTNELIL